MLKQAWQWFLYGESQIFYIICLAVGVILLMIGTALIRPSLQQCASMREQWITAQQKFNHQSSMLNSNSVHPIAEPSPIPWLKLAQEYDLVSKPKNKQIYFAGSTDQTMQLLIHVLRHYGKVIDFRIEKNHYKTLLVVDINDLER